MISAARKVFAPLFHLFYPHNCAGCGTDLSSAQDILCLQCFDELPYTGFSELGNNPVESIFHGRVSVVAAMSELYFSKGSIVQSLIHELKYKGRKDVGILLGNLIGKSISASDRFWGIDLMVPLPLTPARERSRGYNQAEILCTGIHQVTNIPILTNVLVRTRTSSTQTKKKRGERWKNVESNFSITDGERLSGKHVLLVDDVITTGATLDASGTLLLTIPGVQLSIASLAWATK